MGKEKKVIDEPWKQEWLDMPEFIQKDLSPIKRITVNFNSKEDIEAFEILIGQKLPEKRNYIWFPKKPYADLKSMEYVDAT